MKESAALSRFAAQRVVRLATVDPDGSPHIVPITFALEGRRLVTAVDHKPKKTRALRRLANIEHEPRVSLLADDYFDDWNRLWWARLDGVARVVAGGDDFDEAIELLAAKYAQYRAIRPEGPVISIAIDGVAGWAASDNG